MNRIGLTSLGLLTVVAPLPATAQETVPTPSAPEYTGVEVIPGVTVILDDRYRNADFQIVDRIHAGPSNQVVEMQNRFETVGFSVTLSSRVDTEVAVEFDSPDLLLAEREEWIPLLAGQQRSIQFTAFSQHSGSIRFLNRNGEVIATTQYRVTDEDKISESISLGINFDGGINGSYRIGGPQWSTSIYASHRNGEIYGGVNASYSW